MSGGPFEPVQQVGDGTEEIPIRLGFCQCGCGYRTKLAQRTRFYRGELYVRGTPLPFYSDHSSRPRRREPLFKRHGDGRYIVRTRDGGGEYWYRIVARHILGRELLPSEVVHHLNHDVTDDRPENLSVLGRGDHGRLHNKHGFQMKVEALA